MIRELPFAAAFVYSTRGTSPVSVKSREFRSRIKRADVNLFAQIATHVSELVTEGVFAGYFGPDVTLVPVPGHAPLAPGAVMLTERIASALVRAGLAGQVECLLERSTAVAKSATSEPDKRPSVEIHYASLAVRPSLLAPQRILILDDFVTRGTMLLASAAKLRDAYPGVDVRAFALVRSITSGEIEQIRAPCVGTIKQRKDGTTVRMP